jgi:hypothetical protein
METKENKLENENLHALQIDRPRLSRRHNGVSVVKQFAHCKLRFKRADPGSDTGECESSVPDDESSLSDLERGRVDSCIRLARLLLRLRRLPVDMR